MKKLFFQSSLPRAGSTIFQNIIGQNPDFYVTPTSGVIELVHSARFSYSNAVEFKAQDAELMRKGFLNFCHYGIQGFFAGVTDKPYVLDKSRGWGIHYEFLNSFYPNPKIICMVRDPRDIFASMEKNFRKNQHLDSGMIDHVKMIGTTTEKRVTTWASTLPVGLAFERLYQIFKEGIQEKILFIRYEDLLNNPDNEIKRFYSYLDLPYFQHDFDNIQQITQEDDNIYGMFGDHKIKPKLEYKESNANDILGTNVTAWIKNNYNWFFEIFGYV